MADSSDAVLAAVWSVLLDFFADGVSFVFMVGGLLLMSGVDMRGVRVYDDSLRTVYESLTYRDPLLPK